MCRWMAYVGEPIYLEDLLLRPAHSLIHQSLDCREGAARTNGDGFGIGWYGSKPEPGVYKEVLPAWNDNNLRTLSEQIRSPMFFAHVRASTGTETTRPNCHPFSHENWLFMHNGKIGGYDLCRRQLENLLSDDLYHCRRGSTDSELIFLLLVQNGLDADPHRAILETVQQIISVVQDSGSTESLQLTACLADGENLYACRYGSSAVPPTLYWTRTDGNILLASEPIGIDAAEWNEVNPNEIFTATDRIFINPMEKMETAEEMLALKNTA